MCFLSRRICVNIKRKEKKKFDFPPDEVSLAQQITAQQNPAVKITDCLFNVYCSLVNL